MGQPSPPKELSVESDRALGPRSDASFVRRSQSARIPAPARIPIEALAMADQTARSEPPHGREVVSGGGTVSSTPRAPSLPPPITRFAHYDVLGRIAIGGMAEIYLGRESVEGGALRQLALKVLRRQDDAGDGAYFEELFLREGRTAAQLVHPNICHTYSFGKWSGHLYIAMEWIDGVSLSHMLRTLAASGRPLDPLIAVSIAAQVAGALDYAHNVRDARRQALAIVHRDVNPQNIMIRHDGMVKLLDFGVAQVDDKHTDSRGDTFKGKFGYMAPEQARQGAIDGRADVFALGVCLYEMLTGTRLYKRESVRETVEAVLLEPFSSMRVVAPSLPAELDSVVQLALAKDPNDRYASAADMQAALETFLARSGEVVSARRISAMMDSLYPEARGAAPSLFTGPDVTARLRALLPEPESAAPSVTPIEPMRQRIGMLRAVLMIGVLLLVCGLTWAWSKGQPTARPALSTSVPARARPAPPAAPTPTAAEPPHAAPTPTPAPAAAAPGLDTTRPEPSAHKPEGTPARRRRRSPGFVANPGF